jgi:phage tail sheath protein FI
MQGHPTGGSTVANDGVTVTNTQLANYIIQNIAAARRDCVAFVTPDDAMVLNNQNNEAQALVDWRNALTSSSYAVCDSGYKQMYDRYNDVYRYVPSNGDLAGLCAYTDYVRAPWWSPAFFNRGQLKNVVQMRWNPSDQADRDLLYQNGINPVVSFPGQGTVLYGDKTMLSAPSAFDRINVRRLFIVLETAIDTAMKYYLGEFNDSITRAAIVNVVNPYLQTIQAQRGIQNFDVICDTTNNTGQVIDSDQLVLDVYIKPSHAIDFIQINYRAVKTSVSFSEVVGTLG